MNIILIILAGAIGFVIGRKSVKTILSQSPEAQEKRREEADEALDERTEGRKAQILEMMKDEVARQEQLDECNIKNSKKGIVRKDVEKRLGVSRDTAIKYLNELEKEGRIRQVGEAGKGVYYELTK
jgi:Fic family protein